MDLFTYQQRTFPVLLGWSAGSIVAGWLWRRFGKNFWKGFGDQFIGWGIVDGLIASLGFNSARKNAVRRSQGQLDRHVYYRQRRNFSLLVGFNILLDVAYMMVGRDLITRSEASYRKGSGWGVLVQGGFLLVWDVLLLLLLPRKGRDHGA